MPQPSLCTSTRPTASRRQCLVRLAGLLGAGPSLGARAQPGDAIDAADAALQAAIAGSHRSPANRARDAARHPYETLRFFGVQAHHQVVELAPGAGWYTEILAPYLRERGRLYAAHYAADSGSEGQRRSRANYQAKLAATPALYDRVQLGTVPSGPAFTDLAPTGGADQVLTFRNLHNWLEDGTLDARLRAFFSVLKPGGVFGVVDHRAAPGTPLERQQRSGYLEEALVIERARAAGFVLEARSEINANARDTRDHPHGVWSLPPSLQGGAQDRERFLAIGESDRFTHRYLKPR